MKEKAININLKELKKIQYEDEDYQKNILGISDDVERGLKQAVTMSNSNENRVGLIFRSKLHGKLKIKSSVLMLGAKYIVIQGGKTIPVGSIEKVVL